MDFASDLSILYSDFGTAVIVNGDAAHPVRGIFRLTAADALGISGVRPTFRTSRSSPIVRGANVSIDGINYKALAGAPFGTLETIWPLEKV